MMVNGGDLHAFWRIYKLHNRPHIRRLLEEYRIGTLAEDEARKIEGQTDFASYYGTDPARPRAAEGKLRIPSEHPWNSEPKQELLTQAGFYTPNDLFFVRNHNNVPIIEDEDYVLEIEENEALGIKECSFTLKELQEKFKSHVVVSALQCAGNRQEEFITPERPLFVAPHWRNGAIGNAKWEGPRVRDVLRAAGMDVDGMALGEKGTSGMKIVNFIAYDEDETGVPYAGVIPVEKVLDPFGDAILAMKMNGETLPRDHGYPARLLAPGHAGCRNVKWVKRIAVTAEASELDSGSRLDRHFAPDVSWTDHRRHCDPKDEEGHTLIRTDQGPVIQTLPVQSIVCDPPNETVLPAKGRDTITVRGIAWSGGGRGICRVEASLDGGANFTAAELLPQCGQCDQDGSLPPPEQGMGRNWAWTQWEAQLPIPKDVQEKVASGQPAKVDICCKAVDGDFNSQPEKMTATWNVLGIVVNHWSHSKVTLCPVTPSPVVKPQPPAGYWKYPEQEGEKVPLSQVTHANLCPTVAGKAASQVKA